jgi:hypothetical protein
MTTTEALLTAILIQQIFALVIIGDYIRQIKNKWK